MNKTISLNVINDLTEIERTHQIIEQFGHASQLSKQVINSMKLTVEELLNNVISYGYTDENEHQILIQITLDETAVALRITHDGDPFDPLTVPEPEPDQLLQDMPIGGLGIHLIKEVMDSLEYTREGDHNIIEVKKHLS